MGAPGTHLGGHGRVAMQGIAGDDAALQNQAFQGCQRSRHLIAARRVAGRQRQPGLGIPHAHHQWRHVAAAALIAAPQALAVDGDHAPGGIEPEPLAQRRDETSESPCHLVRIEQTEHPAEAVVARCAMTKIDDLVKLVLVGSSKIRDIDTTLRTTQSRRQPDEQHSRKIMSSIEVTGVPDFTKDRDQWFHHGSPESGKPSSESTFYFMAIELYSDAIPLQ